MLTTLHSSFQFVLLVCASMGKLLSAMEALVEVLLDLYKQTTVTCV